MADLPALSDTPLSHPNCCLSLSSRLLETLKSLLRNGSCCGGEEPSSGLVLSVGCGSGLLEALLHTYLTQEEPKMTTMRVEGAEVATAASTIMAYLPEDRANTVAGTWALCRRAEDATVLMFVYPRSADLVRRYVDEFLGWEKARTIVWLGPQADWEVFRPTLEKEHWLLETTQLMIREGAECGIGEYEMMAVLQVIDHKSLI
ncbi:hypothetical protein PG993_002892 [Apiospora rasikravindrae]|uniref:Uncharacterized protein n=1 Tax=Apiospora rasikravindrae TaxID=990691 RepID=A0ABR1TY04_9PEZI